MTALEFLLVALAAYRITRLVTTDTILDRQRDWVAVRFGQLGKLHTLVTCPFCAGFWVSCAVLGFALGADLVRLPWEWAIIVAWSIAGAQALCSSIDAKLNEEH